MLIEADLQETYRVDFRDFYRPRGGASRLTLRRLIVLVAGLNEHTSRFWAAVFDRDPFSVAECVQMDIFAAVDGQEHPYKTAREDRKRREEREKKKKRIKQAEKRRQLLLKQRAARKK